MTVPVEEAVAALSTFSLEVQPFSLVFGFLIGFFVSFLFLLLPLSCFFLHFTKHFPQSTCNQHCRHPIILITTCCLLLKSIASRFNLSNFHTGSSFSFSLPFSSSDDVFCICECGSAICKCAHNQPNSWILWRARFFQDPQTRQTIACHSKALRFLQWKLLCTTYYWQRWETNPFWIPQMSFDFAALDWCAVFLICLQHEQPDIQGLAVTLVSGRSTTESPVGAKFTSPLNLLLVSIFRVFWFFREV